MASLTVAEEGCVEQGYKMAIEEEYKDVVDRSRKLGAAIKTFRNQTPEEHRTKSLLEFYKSLQQENLPNNFPVNEISNIVDEAKRVIEKIEILNNSYKRNNLFEVQRQKALREAERSDMWKLFWQRLARWTVGIISAVILYSLLVLVSEKTDFIKVPIKDMVQEATKPKPPVKAP